MLTDQKRYYNAYQQGVSDQQAGIPARLEICEDNIEYGFYIRGRQSTKCLVVPEQPKKIVEELAPPIKLDI